MWWIYALLSAVFASLTALFAKQGVENINSNLATGIRTLVILALVWSIVFVNGDGKSISQLPKQSLIFLIVSGITTGLSWLFYFKAIQVGQVSQVAVVDKLSVALTVLIALIFLGESLSIKSAIGITLIVSGTVLMIFK